MFSVNKKFYPRKRSNQFEIPTSYQNFGSDLDGMELKC
jgi:hypothetical protein